MNDDISILKLMIKDHSKLVNLINNLEEKSKKYHLSPVIMTIFSGVFPLSLNGLGGAEDLWAALEEI